MRSKVKRSFRSKKREDGIYAATEAARLARLNAKLTSVTARDKEGDVALPDAEGEGAEEIPGWSWFTVLGLLDPADITAESMEGALGGPREWSSDGIRSRCLKAGHGIAGDDVLRGFCWAS